MFRKSISRPHTRNTALSPLHSGACVFCKCVVSLEFMKSCVCTDVVFMDVCVRVMMCVSVVCPSIYELSVFLNVSISWPSFTGDRGVF